MSKFATATKAATFSPVRSTTEVPDTLTHEGGAGYSRDPKSELFLLAITNMVSEQTFYEDGKTRDARFEDLIAQVTKDDPEWIARFVPYLRDTMNMRSASLVMAAEYVRAKGPKGRAVIDSALKRSDEPAEMIGYWLGRYGKRIPQPVKRGVADAVIRLYDERAALKYDGDKGVRMGDVIELVHPKPRADWQGALFEYLIAKRHNRERLDTEALPTIRERTALEALLPEVRRARLADGLPNGTTWEWASSWLGGKLDGAFWDAMIPNMGIFALVRNLRNFDDAGISETSRDLVLAKLTDPDVIQKSHMFPLRFYAAWANTGSMTWGTGLDAALNHSLANVPALSGKTLVLVDMSGSMTAPLSARSKINRDKAAAIFGTALALRAEHADLIAFGTGTETVPFRKGDSLLRVIEGFREMGGTQTVEAILAHYKDHDRIIVLTDEQAFAWGSRGASFLSYGIGGESQSGMAKIEAIPAVIYTFNLAGYEAGHLPSGRANRHTFGGLSDAAFMALSLLERGSDADWPF